MAGKDVLRIAHDRATDYLETLPVRGVAPSGTLESLRAALGGPLPDDGLDPAAVVEALARDAEPGLVATSGPRYFGFVIGGALPAAMAADWLAAAWDQNAGLYASSPAASVVEEVAAGWLLDRLGLPPSCSVGFVTGGQMANATCLAAARHEVLRAAGWDVERDGLTGAPEIRLVAGTEAHVTIETSCRLLGLGGGRICRVGADDQGRIRPAALERALDGCDGPLIVCAQAGNVDTGAFDPFDDIARLTHERGGWLHVDGAFGLWAGASDALRHLVTGVEAADSWATDAHKWLNVPYDSGLAIVARPQAHRASMSLRAAYLVHADGEERDPLDWTPEFSRRARGFAVYAALRSLGRRGIASMVERCCAHARLMADLLSRSSAIEILNEVVLNQVLVGVRTPAAGGRDMAEIVREAIARVRRGGVCWLGGTMRQERPAIRISVSNWSTTEEDIRRSAQAILEAVHGAMS